ncbi:hypothetical protein Ahy_B06g084067 [Arachis hypogaea]|uniref:Prephenate/arogenate dehydrogenase domain-containing protein n=1 Tax=Arachis hypogaea TaxID=3818 RepID=A0A444YR36_ARAHY|nr:hypothetical protein Ahy_B06g084067 [Arachis hypogaea]
MHHVVRNQLMKNGKSGFASNNSSPSDENTKLKIAIVGFGNFGQFLAKTIVSQAHEVLAYSRSDYSNVARSWGDADDIFKQHPEVILLCIFILSMVKVLKSLPFQRLKRTTLFADFSRNLFLQHLPPDFDVLCTHPIFGPESGKNGCKELPLVYDKVRIRNEESRILRCYGFFDIFGNFAQFLAATLVRQGHTCNTLFVNVLSVKEFPKKLLLELLPSDFDILCTNPMFRPESALDGWTGLPFVFEKVRTLNEEHSVSRREKFCNAFAREGYCMVEMNCEDHNLYATSSKFITHTVGRILQGLKLELTPINTNFLPLHHATIPQVTSQNHRRSNHALHCNLQSFSPNSITLQITLSAVSSTVTLSSHPHSHYCTNRITIDLPPPTNHSECMPSTSLSTLTTRTKEFTISSASRFQFLVATLVCQGHTSSLTPDPTTSLQPENLVYRGASRSDPPFSSIILKELVDHDRYAPGLHFITYTVGRILEGLTVLHTLNCHSLLPSTILLPSKLNAYCSSSTYRPLRVHTIIYQGHTILAHSRSDHFTAARKFGVSFFRNPDDLCEDHPELILLCSSIISTKRVLITLPLQRLKCSTLFVDVLSAKEFPKKLLLELFSSDFNVLCTHPMFRPESAPDG